MSQHTKRFLLYRQFLRLYPQEYQTQYAEQMLQTLEDMLENTPDRAGRAAIWARAILDLLVSITGQQLSYIGGTMNHEIPAYVKRNAIIGAGLLTPFLIILIAAVLTGDRLQDGILWHTNVLFVWIVVLPLLASLLNISTFFVWMRTRHTGFWRSVLDLKHSWPMVGVLLVGVFILALVFGHDSVHCVAGNPIRELHNWHQTWRCVGKG